MAAQATLLFLALLSCVLTETSAEEHLVTLKHGGEILGNTLLTQNGRTIFAFRSVPYAEPPIGQLRFKNAVPKAAWTGQPIDATVDVPSCVQPGESGNIIGQEDCLYINVYSPKLPQNDRNKTKMVVMVYVHGGAFVTGSSSPAMYGPGRLLDEDIILVTMNYRLGALGFLSTGDSVSPGNYGLLDQSLALQWVKDHIEVFGGDPNQVTLFGESAGAACVGFHLLSPKSAGLFHSAITQSGSSLGRWALQENPLYLAKRLAVDLECSTQDNAEMVECLRQIPAVQLIKTGALYNKYGLVTAFVPAVDGSFVPKKPREIISSGQANIIPYISGINKDEGLMFYAYLYLNVEQTKFKQVVEDIIRETLDKEGRAGETAKLIMDEYFSGLDWTNETSTRHAIVKVFSDFMFIMPHYETVNLLTKNGFHPYVYSLDYAPSGGLLANLGINENWGVSHGDDIGLLFDGNHLKNLTEDDLKIMKVLLPAWTNFAKYSNPTPNIVQDKIVKWESSEVGNMEVYHIDNPVTIATYKTDEDRRYTFWTKIVPQSLNHKLSVT